MHHKLVVFASCIGLYAATIGGCTPTQRSYEGEGLSGGGASGGGSGGDGTTSSSSSGVGGAGGMAGAGGAGGGVICPPATADCNQDGVCEANLLGDVNHCGICNNPCIPPNGGTAECVGGQCVLSCGQGAADCDQNPATACQDLLSDGQNCGACGHSCLGAVCFQGECQPVVALDTTVVTSGQPVSLAVFGTEVYWGTSIGQVAKTAFDGSTYQSIGMVNNGSPVNGLAVTAQGVYATNGSRVTCFLGMGGTWGSVNDSGVNAVAADNNYVVWSATGQGRVRRADALGGNNKDIGNLEIGPTSIVFDGSMVRWANTGGAEIRERTVLDNGITSTIFADTPNPRLLVQDGNTFYWVSNDTLIRGVLGSLPESVYPLSKDVRALAVDSTHLYWTVGDLGEVWRAARNGLTQPIMVASGQAEPHAIAIGPDSVFWANRASGIIMRLAR